MFMKWKVLLVPMALAAMSSSLLAARTALPGTLNYVEGQVSINGQTITAKDAGSAQMAPNQVVETGHGKTEMLLTPGVFLRVGDNSAVRMVSPNLADTSVELLHGEAAVEVLTMVCGQNVSQLAHVIETFAGDQFAGGIDVLVAFGVTPNAECVEILHGQSNGIHARMTGRAERLITVRGEQIAQGGVAGGFFGSFQRRNVWRRWWCGRAEDVV